MIQLNYRDAMPIYQQVKQGMNKLIAAGAIAVGEKLLPATEYGSKLALNPSIIMQAYEELADEGILSQLENGDFVVANIQKSMENQLFFEFDQAVKKLLQLSVTPKEIEKRLQLVEEKGI